MDVIIELSPEVSRQIQNHVQISSSVEKLTTTIDSLKVIIKPQYRDQADITSKHFFVIATKNLEECQRIASTLDQLPAVKAAYCKPEAEPAYLP